MEWRSRLLQDVRLQNRSATHLTSTFTSNAHFADLRLSLSPAVAPASARVSYQPLTRLTTALANAYVANGAKVFISGRRAEVLDKAVKDLKAQAGKGGDIVA